MPKKKIVSTPEQDRKRFVSTAREHGCDKSPEAFEAAVRKLASAKPVTNEEVKRKAKKKPKA